MKDSSLLLLENLLQFLVYSKLVDWAAVHACLMRSMMVVIEK